MASQSLAKRYAKALSSLSIEEDRLEKVVKNLSSFISLFEESSELREALLNPVFSIDERKKVLKSILDHLKVDHVTENFLLVLLENKRLEHVWLVDKIFKRLIDRHLNRIQVEVLSAHPIEKSVSKRLGQTFETLTNKEATMQFQVDPKLIGGMVLKIGSLVFDSSIANQLDTLALSFRREL